MDTIFYNGKIYTEDRAYPICSAVAVKNGVIVALGADEEILKTAGPETEKDRPGGTSDASRICRYPSAHAVLCTGGKPDRPDGLQKLRRCEEALCRACGLGEGKRQMGTGVQDLIRMIGM